MRLVGNLIWFVLAGLWLAIGYLVAAALMAITIIGLPFAFQAVKHSPGWTRTNNPSVNSRMLCQLSYRGSAGESVAGATKRRSSPRGGGVAPR